MSEAILDPITHLSHLSQHLVDQSMVLPAPIPDPNIVNNKAVIILSHYIL